MAVFFFLVGLEIEREFVEGLSTGAQATLPPGAALAPRRRGWSMACIRGSRSMVTLAGAPRPADASWAQCFGMALLCGIGFTMSLFIGGLAFEGQAAGYEAQLKLGVLAGSVIAGVLGSLVLARAGRRGPSP